MRWHFLVLMLSFVLLPSAAQGEEEKLLPVKWQSKHYQSNKLVGKIFSTEGKSIAVKELLKLLQTGKYFLFGETHNNPDHHIIQGRLVKYAAGNKPALVFEMVPERLQPVLDRVNIKTDPELVELGVALEWKKRGWYAWDIYKPIFISALNNGLALKAGNLDRSKTRRISKKGMESLTANEQNHLFLNVELNEKLSASLMNELKASHCGMLPTRALDPMSIVQRARDGAMAQALLNAGEKGAILIAGNGHVRKDRGVPRLLNHPSVVVGLIEVREGNTDFTDYPLTNQQNTPLYDIVIFTPKFDISDPCIALRKQFGKIKKETK